MAKSKLKPKSKRSSRPARAKAAKSHSRAQRAVTKHAAGNATLKYIPWHTVELEDLKPLLQRQFVVGQEIMLARVLSVSGIARACAAVGA